MLKLYFNKSAQFQPFSLDIIRSRGIGLMKSNNNLVFKFSFCRKTSLKNLVRTSSTGLKRLISGNKSLTFDIWENSVTAKIISSWNQEEFYHCAHTNQNTSHVVTHPQLTPLMIYVNFHLQPYDLEGIWKEFLSIISALTLFSPCCSDSKHKHCHKLRENGTH